MSIEYKQVNVTPEMAGKWLDRHWQRIADEKYRQRPISLTRIMRYAQAMKDGQWGLDPNPIVFDTNDNLANGQHRLEAVRKSGITIAFTISTGWPPETINVLDQGSTRSNTALLALCNGYGGYAGRYAGTVGAIGRVAFRGHTAAVSFANCEYMLDKLGLKGNIDAIMTKSPNFLKDFTSAVVAPLSWYHTVRPGKAMQFAEAIFNYETVKGSPAQLYLNWIKSGRWQATEAGKTVKTYERKMSGLVACLRAWDTNTTMARVVAQPDVVDWLADMNPKLRDWCRAHIARGSGYHKETKPVAKAKE